jgi:hypothetical protein
MFKTRERVATALYRLLGILADSGNRDARLPHFLPSVGAVTSLEQNSSSSQVVLKTKPEYLRMLHYHV